MSRDALDGADIGETRRVTETVDMATINFEPDVFFGTDRISESEVSDVEVTVDDDGFRVVRVTFEGDVTKCLPPRWDHSNEPRTAAEADAERKKRWVGRAATVLSFGIPIAISTAVAVVVMNTLASKLTINGTTVGPVGVFDVLPLVFIAILFAIIIHGLQGGLPRGAGGARR